MNNNVVKKVVSYILIALVILFTIITLLGIWEVLEFRLLMKKLVLSLLVIFGASAVTLFIFTVLLNEPQNKEIKK